MPFRMRAMAAPSRTIRMISFHSPQEDIQATLGQRLCT
jgi:hypothetical protein